MINSDLEGLYEISGRSIVDSYKTGGSNYRHTPGSGSDYGGRRSDYPVGIGPDLGPVKPVVETVQQALASKLQGMYRAKKELNAASK